MMWGIYDLLPGHVLMETWTSTESGWVSGWRGCVRPPSPDVVITSRAARVVIMGELTVPWEDNVQDAYERKKEKYEELRLQCTERGWRAHCFPFEVSCRGFIAQSTIAFLRSLGIGGQCMRKACKDLEVAAESGSAWIWWKRWEETIAVKLAGRAHHPDVGGVGPPPST